MKAVILAGGKGTRLKPYTTVLPKPLMPINGELPIIEIIIKQLKKQGFCNITIAVGYLHEIIMAFCGDGRKWGVEIEYSIEQTPLSTIGPLTLLENLPENILVLNGDVLTDLSYKDLMEYHVTNCADVTVATYMRTVRIDFGVMEYSDHVIKYFREKPTYKFDVSMGVYCINKKIIDRLIKSMPYGFDNLMMDGIQRGERIMAYPFRGYWLDIGRPDDYDMANEDYERIKNDLMK